MKANGGGHGTRKPALVCVIGAECTGKTTLCHALAEHCDGLCVDEHLRNFCLLHGRTPMRSEQAGIAQAQLEAQAAALQKAESAGKAFVFCDGSALLTALYSLHYFEDGSLLAAARAAQSRYQLTLLLEPDLPWAPDAGLRDGPGVREAVHSLLEAEASRLGDWVRIRGSDPARLQCAKDAMSRL